MTNDDEDKMKHLIEKYKDCPASALAFLVKKIMTNVDSGSVCFILNT